MTTKLKPCPFCGGKALLDRKGNAKVSMVIICEDCGCTLESGDVFGLTKTENLAWNQRSKAK